MKRFLLYFLIVFSVHSAMAQDGSRLRAIKVAYLTNRMNLTPEEAQRFWPVYNQYSDELIIARVKVKKENKTELELEEIVLNIRKKYNSEFNKVLPAEKVEIFYRAEKEFGNYIKNEIERRQLRQQQKRSMLNRP